MRKRDRKEGKNERKREIKKKKERKIQILRREGKRDW